MKKYVNSETYPQLMENPAKQISLKSIQITLRRYDSPRHFEAADVDRGYVSYHCNTSCILLARNNWLLPFGIEKKEHFALLRDRPARQLRPCEAGLRGCIEVCHAKAVASTLSFLTVKTTSRGRVCAMLTCCRCWEPSETTNSANSAGDDCRAAIEAGRGYYKCRVGSNW